MKKKFLAVLLAGAMVLGVTACGSNKDSSKSTTEAVKKTMKCKHCGADNSNESKFCFQCG